MLRIISITSLMLFLCGCDGAGESTKQHTSKSDDKSTKQISDFDGMVLVPAGTFIMGSEKQDEEGLQERFGFIEPLYRDEHPQHQRYLPAFYIDSYEVTNQQYKRYIKETGSTEPVQWTQNAYNVSQKRLASFQLPFLRQVAADYFKLDLDTREMNKQSLLAVMEKEQQRRNSIPVVGVSWYAADKFCQWRNARLPTEAEWEKAARGTDGREFPSGNEWKMDITNTGENVMDEEGVVAVGSFPLNSSPYGAYDMAGNVWEWTADWYQPYPDSDYASEKFGENFKVMRGGGGGIGHYSLNIFFRTPLRGKSFPNEGSLDLGFRCARDASSS